MLTVSNLTSPVLFSMAGMNSTNGTQSLCSFWSPTLNRIDSQGCTGVPTPAPANHSIAFVPGFTAVNDSVLAWAWNISGPLAANCSQDVLYCSVTPKRKIYLNPYDPFMDGAVSCPNGSSLALRVFYGAKCGLWQHNNSAGCSWNAIKQANHACPVDPPSMGLQPHTSLRPCAEASPRPRLQSFEGGGCVASPKTRCMCRHLTDFVGVKKPTIAVCSASQMTGLSANDIFVKLKLLFTIIAVLFGAMNLGAGLAWAMDARARSSTAKLVFSPAFGCRISPRGIATWRLQQDPLSGTSGLVGAVGGSCVEICRLLGIPMVRFRASVPEEWFEGSVAECVGRLEGLSVEAVEHQRVKAALEELCAKRSGGWGLLRRRWSSRIPEFELDQPEASTRGSAVLAQHSAAQMRRSSAVLKEVQSHMSENKSKHSEAVETLCGTALIFALLSVRSPGPPPPLSLPVLECRIQGHPLPNLHDVAYLHPSFGPVGAQASARSGDCDNGARHAEALWEARSRIPGAHGQISGVRDGEAPRCAQLVCAKHRIWRLPLSGPGPRFRGLTPVYPCCIAGHAERRNTHVWRGLAGPSSPVAVDLAAGAGRLLGSLRQRSLQPERRLR